jgi:hypothetical protein
MREHPLWTWLAGLAIGCFGAAGLFHLVHPFERPPRWGRRRQVGMPMSRRSILLTGGSFLVLGITIIATTFGIPWVERRVLPAVFVITFLAWASAWLHDFDSERDA